MVSARLSRGGRTAREAAQLTGLTIRTIQRWTSEERATYEARATERRTQIIKLHRQGHGVRATARHLGIDPGLVSKRLKEARHAGTDLTPFPDSNQE